MNISSPGTCQISVVLQTEPQPGVKLGESASIPKAANFSFTLFCQQLSMVLVNRSCNNAAVKQAVADRLA